MKLDSFSRWLPVAALVAACSDPGRTLNPDASVTPDIVVADITCPMDQLACGAACVDPRTDVNHCGACGVTCGAGGVCINGTCLRECPTGQTRCGTFCVSTDTDVENCGACRRACPEGQVCSAGRCEQACGAPYLVCDRLTTTADGGVTDASVRRDTGVTLPQRYCTNPRTDERNCGACGTICPLGQRCEDGACALYCNPRQTRCGDRCADLQTDNANCGACGTACGAMSRCMMGACVAVTCPGGTTQCGTSCVLTDTDPANCGRCGNVCAPHQVCSTGMCLTECRIPSLACGGRCVDVQRDPANCGMCGNACPTGQTCAMGMCRLECPMGTTLCGGRCVDVTTDASHCGMCGRACIAGQLCRAGTCAPTCAPTQTECAGVCVDAQVDPANCGGCGITCGTNYACAAGLCSALPTAMNPCPVGSVRCGTVCANLRGDNAHCGACGRACTADRTCIAGACVPPCAAGQDRCGGVCTTVSSDRNNCGMCGRACPMGMSCGGGMCVTEPSFRVASFGATGCRIVEHASVTGDDRGGIAASQATVLYTGDTSTGRFAAADLAGGTAVGVQHDALVGDLQTETMYSFGISATVPVPNGGAIATHLIEIDPMTGRLGTRAIALSTPIPMTSGSGIFSGFGRIAVWSALSRTVYQVRMPTGEVTMVGTLTFPSHATCESWAFWGVAEYFDNGLHLAYANSTSISRVRVSTAAVTVASMFTSLSDMCSFTLIPSRNRWYFHHEGASQFGGSDESVGYCDARWESP